MKTSLKYALLAGAIAAFAGMASATPTIYITDGTNSETIVGNATTGIVSFAGTFDNWTLNFDTGVTYPSLGSSSSPQMDLQFGAYVLNASSTAVNKLQIFFSENGFTGVGTASANVGGTITGTGLVNYASFGGTSNTILDYSLSNRLTVLPPVNPFYTGPTFAGSATSGTVLGGGPYSLTMGIGISETGIGSVTGDAFLSVPDSGTTLMLLGAGLSALGFVGSIRRRFFKS